MTKEEFVCRAAIALIGDGSSWDPAVAAPFIWKSAEIVWEARPEWMKHETPKWVAQTLEIKRNEQPQE